LVRSPVGDRSENPADHNNEQCDPSFHLFSPSVDGSQILASEQPRLKSSGLDSIRKEADMPKRVLVPLVATAAIALTAIGLIAWIAADPQYWFPGAYAAKGQQGDVGPRGPRGASGPPGPVGPDAEAAISDLSDRLDDLETGTGDQADSSVTDLSDKLSTICDAIDTEYTYASPGSEIESVLDDLNNACT
jgi:hypothetical protein